MGLNRILLAEKDMEYGSALAAAISNLHNDFEITVLDLEKYCSGREKGYQAFLNGFDLILVGGYSPEALEDLHFLSSNRNKLVLLMEYPAENLVKQTQNENRKCWYLYKYVRISELTSDLNFISTLLTGRKRFIRESISPDMIGFYSAGGGVGKTALAIAAARELSRYHDKRVLYLSFEEIPATELFVRANPTNRNIGDYLYFLLEKQEDNLCSRLDAFISVDEYGVETLYPSGGLNDLRCLGSEDLACFLKAISDSGRYDYLILDLNCDLSKDTLFLLEQCGKIVLIQNDRPVSHHKSRKLITYMEKTGLIRSPEELIFVVNRRTETDMETDCSEDKSLKGFKRIYVENDRNSFRYANNHLEISIEHVFGIGVKKIADELLIPENGGKANEHVTAADGFLID